MMVTKDNTHLTFTQASPEGDLGKCVTSLQTVHKRVDQDRCFLKQHEILTAAGDAAVHVVHSTGADRG